MRPDQILVASIYCLDCGTRHGESEDATFRDVNRTLDTWADAIPCCPRCASREVWVTLIASGVPRVP